MSRKRYEDYLKQALINEELVFFLCKNCHSKNFFKWVFVIIYYTALHYFCAFLVNKGDGIPKTHISKNDYDEGDIDLAKRKFYTVKNEISHSAGVDYEQLFFWSQDVRYNPDKLQLTSIDELETAIKYLKGIKIIMINEIECLFQWDEKKKEVEFKKANTKDIALIYKKWKN